MTESWTKQSEHHFPSELWRHCYFLCQCCFWEVQQHSAQSLVHNLSLHSETVLLSLLCYHFAKLYLVWVFLSFTVLGTQCVFCQSEMCIFGGREVSLWSLGNFFLSACFCLVTQMCPTLCDPADCSPPGSSVNGIFHARTPQWVVISFSRGSSSPRDQTHISCIGRQIFYHWATREARPLCLNTY